MYIVAITGASGPVLGIRLIEELLASGKEVSGIASETALKVIHHEIFNNKENPSTLTEILTKRNCSNLSNFREYRNNDFFSPLASGTSGFNALIIMPCSMKTLSAIANGFSDSLISRVADISLKEGRQCIIVPRETPLNLIHLENLMKVKRAGAEIHFPVMSFYTFPKKIEDMIDFIIGKTLNLLGIEHDLFQSWGS